MKTFLGNIAPLPGNDSKPHPVDIVFQLGRTRRFGGAGHPEWTVLHHSMLTTFIYMKLHGCGGAHHALLHDCHEAYTGDIPTPIKNVLDSEGVRKLESHLDMRIYDMLGINLPENHLGVKTCDLAALIIEAYYFGNKALDIEHIGEANWRKYPPEFQAWVAKAVKESCPEVYTAMVRSITMRPVGTYPEWSKL